MKKLLLIIGCCLMTMAVHAQSGLAKQQAWKIGHVRPAGSAIDNDVRAMTEGISAATGGSINFAIYPANKLGDYSVVQERVSFGEVEMYVGPFGTTVDKKLMLAFIPFLVDTWPEAQRLLDHPHAEHPGADRSAHREHHERRRRDVERWITSASTVSLAFFARSRDATTPSMMSSM